MTGHGWSEHAFEGHKISVDISSVNRKQSEITVALPRELDPLEARARDEVNRRIARGRVTVRVSLHADDGAAASRTMVNTALARSYAAQLKKLGRELGL